MQKQTIRCLFASLLISFIGLIPAHANEEAFVITSELYPDVKFWRKVYTEIPSSKGYIHDDRHLNVVYETVDLQENISRKQRHRLVKKRIRYYKNVLYSIARKPESRLTDKEKAIRALWPEDTSNKELRNAAKRLRFQLGQSDRFKEGLIRSGRWMPYIKKSFQEIGVPVELAALPHVESSFTPTAYSHVGAAGMWQFMRGTGRRYMRIDHVIDERLDPYKSSIAAAHLLKHNYETTGTWPLAITAYNHGTSGMRRAAKKMGSTDIIPILKNYKGRTFGFASRNFYVAFLAALDVSQNADYYFGRVDIDTPEKSITTRIPHYTAAKTVSSKLGLTLETLKKYNSAFRPAVLDGRKYIPRNTLLRLPAYLAKNDPDQLIASIPLKEQFSRQKPDRIYRVRRGDTLSGIADKFRVSLRRLTSLNNLSSRHFIRIGQKIRLPVNASTPRSLASYQTSDDGFYRVRRGDTLTRIAQRFDVPEETIISRNNIRNRNSLIAGQRLKIASLGKYSNQSSDASPALKPEKMAVSTQQHKPAYAELTSMDEEPITTGEEVGILNDSASMPSEDPSDYHVDETQRIKALPMETIGHYATWLEIPASRLRKINHHRHGNPVLIGMKIKLDFSHVTPDIFEQRRMAYHNTVQESYFKTYQITGSTEHAVEKEDNLWDLLKAQLNIPLWLLLQYNPDMRLNHLSKGQTIIFPTVAFKEEPEANITPLP